jgi:hypothetical protein
MATEILTEVPLLFSSSPTHPQRIFCSECGVNAIPSPEGATASTRYTCPPCCASLLKSRDSATAAMFGSIGAQIDASHVGEIGFSDHAGAQP